ncbi:MAG: hypothetical protein COW84_07010 [Gammaproteobacteria bacterium CG22_combo_CG10-13_8_21_14_all_40_8]|nr:MAG: hypothetical protein COW84_07010 [Gammaproteobacteria bacterium CG22_combo_CG10-13_8_21_14_all_40_8]
MKKLLLIISLFYSQLATADFYSANESYQQGDYQTAYQSFVDLAKWGEKRAQFNIGVMYFKGQFVDKDINQAYAWMKLANQAQSFSENQQQALDIVTQQVQDKDEAESLYQDLFQHLSNPVLVQKLYPQLVKSDNEHAFNATPVKLVTPKYPENALHAGMGGRVRFKMDIDKKGKPRNIQLVESLPKKTFDKAALRAVKKWTFEPSKNEAGKPVYKKDVYYTLNFIIKDQDWIKINHDMYDKTKQQAELGDSTAQYKIAHWNKVLNGFDKEVNPTEWFLKSAIQGNSYAQYEVGRSLIRGAGCIMDKSKGMEWLTTAANNGNDEAKMYLGSLDANQDNLESQQRALKFLSGQQELQADVLLDYAWMLAKSPYPEIADPQRALELSQQLTKLAFWDDASVYEIQAAAYAAMDKYSDAVEYQKKALREAKSMKVDLQEINSHLALYQQNKRWF